MDQKALSLLSAAARHVRDAEHLASVPSPDRSIDQAFHLAGFGPECARKAALPRRTYDKAIGHGVNRDNDHVLVFALAMDPAARRYDLADWQTKYPELAKWNESARYEATGTRHEPQVNTLVREAKAIVDRIVFALWADGEIPGGSSW